MWNDVSDEGAAVNQNSCLIIIDVQKGIFGLKQPVYKAEELLGNLQMVIAAARKKKMKIIFTQHENTGVLKKGTAGWEFVEVIAPHNGDLVVPKKHSGMFQETELLHLLRQRKINRIYLAGLISNGCVKHCCLDGVKNGFAVTCIADAHSTFYRNAEKIIEATNRELEKRGVMLVTSREFGGKDAILS